MKKNILVLIGLVFATSALIISIGSATGGVNARPDQQTDRWGNPYLVSYQGQIWDGNKPYDGPGYFKFEIMIQGDHIWSNDGEIPPVASVPLDVENGLFTVLLGDTNLTGMTQPLLPEVFYDWNRQIRVWFSPDNDEFIQMPDQMIASVPYAYAAGSAEFAHQIGPYVAGDFQLRVSGTCTEGQMIKEILADGSVVCYQPPTFSSTLIDEGSFWDPAIAIGSDGLGLISFSDNTTFDLMVAHCEDINCTSATITRLDSADEVGKASSIAIGTDGLALISYHDSTNSNIKVAHCSNVECTTATISSLETNGNVVGNTTIAIGADGLGKIAYQTFIESVSYLQFAHCQNITCSENSRITISSTNNADYPSMVIGADGGALISYFETVSRELRVVHCSDLYCYSSTNHTIDSSTDFVGRYTGITIGEDGFGIISYNDHTTDALKVAHCNGAECSAASVYSIIDRLDPDINWSGYQTSIAVGRDGLALVVYYTNTLKIAHCSNTVCRHAEIYGLPAPGEATYASIAIGTDGLGLIATTAAGDLYVLHCSNEQCLPMNWEETP